MSDWSYIDGFYTTKVAKKNSVYLSSIHEYLVPVSVAKRDKTLDNIWKEVRSDCNIIHNGLFGRTCYGGWEDDVYPCDLIPDGTCVVVCMTRYKMENSQIVGMSDYGTPLYLFEHTYPDLHTAMTLMPEPNKEEIGFMITMMVNLASGKSMFRVDTGCWFNRDEKTDRICVRPICVEENTDNSDDYTYINPEMKFAKALPQEDGSISLHRGDYYVIVADDKCKKIIDTYTCNSIVDLRLILSKFIGSKNVHWARSDIFGYNPMYLMVGTDYDVQCIFVYDKNLELLEEI